MSAPRSRAAPGRSKGSQHSSLRAKRSNPALRTTLDCFVAELVGGPATSGRTRWLLAMTRDSIALRLPAMLDFETDQPRQQRRRIELAEHRFEVGETAYQWMDRHDVAKAGGGQRAEAEIEQRRPGAEFRAALWQALKSVRQQNVQKPVNDIKEQGEVHVEHDRPLDSMKRHASGSEYRLRNDK